MAEYSLNQKRLERNCIAPSQSQASVQFTGISVDPWPKRTLPSKDSLHTWTVSRASCREPAAFRTRQVWVGPAMKQTHKKPHEGHKLPAFCCQGVCGEEWRMSEEVTGTAALKGAEVGPTTAPTLDTWALVSGSVCSECSPSRSIMCQYKGLPGCHFSPFLVYKEVKIQYDSSREGKNLLGLVWPEDKAKSSDT